MKSLSIIAATIAAGLSATSLLAQSTLDRANARDERSIEYRKANCPPGQEAACARANAKTERAIENRTPG